MSIVPPNTPTNSDLVNALREAEHRFDEYRNRVNKAHARGNIDAGTRNHLVETAEAQRAPYLDHVATLHQTRVQLAQAREARDWPTVLELQDQLANFRAPACPPLEPEIQPDLPA